MLMNDCNQPKSQTIRFDWAMRRLLRNKANFSVLEGLLTTLLGEKIVIQKLLESESNQEEGMNIGRAEREKHKAIEVVRFLKSSGSSVELIAGATGLSREEIEGL